MLVICNQCQARYKLTIARTPGKAVTFKCGKCQNLIKLSPEEIAAQSGAAAPAPAPAAPAAPAAEPQTVTANCLKCGAAYVKPVDDKSHVCYQCRIDSLVHKIRDKYGVTPGAPSASSAPAPAPETPAAAPAPPAAEVPPAPALSRYTIRSADGLVLGPIKLRTVAVLAREKRISGREEVQKDDGEYRPLLDFPELAELFPGLKEILDTAGLEDKVDEAFMAAFGADEGLDETPAPPPAAAETPTPPPATTAPQPEPVPQPEPEPVAAEPVAAPEPAPEPEPPPQPESATQPEAPPQPEASAEEPSLGLDDLEESAAPDTAAAPVESAPAPVEDAPLGLPAEPPPAAASAEDNHDDVMEIADAFKMERTGPRPAMKAPEKPAAVVAAPPAKIVEKSVVSAPAPAEPEDVGTEFDLGDEDGEEEVIEDLEAIPEPSPDARYRIRYPDGLMLGPIKFATIRELFSSGNITGQEEVQRENEAWAPFSQLPELMVLMAEPGQAAEDVVELTEVLEDKG